MIRFREIVEFTHGRRLAPRDPPEKVTARLRAASEAS